MFQKGERMANVKFAQYQGTVKKKLGFLAFFTMIFYYYWTTVFLPPKMEGLSILKNIVPLQMN